MLHDQRGRRTGEADDPHCLTTSQTAALLAKTPWRRLVVIGDGLASAHLTGTPTIGYRRRPWPYRLHDALETIVPEGRVWALGQRGQRADGIHPAQGPLARHADPDLLIVACGATDLIAARPVERISDDLIETAMRLDRPAAILIPPRPGLPPDPDLPHLAHQREKLATYLTAAALSAGMLPIDLPTHLTGRPHPQMADSYLNLSNRGHAATASAVARALYEHARGRHPLTENGTNS